MATRMGCKIKSLVSAGRPGRNASPSMSCTYEYGAEQKREVWTHQSAGDSGPWEWVRPPRESVARAGLCSGSANSPELSHEPQSSCGRAGADALHCPPAPPSVASVGRGYRSHAESGPVPQLLDLPAGAEEAWWPHEAPGPFFPSIPRSCTRCIVEQQLPLQLSFSASLCPPPQLLFLREGCLPRNTFLMTY